MAHQDLSAAGIVTGQIVEASEITQFVNALTGTPVGGIGYDITISGSLNLTGSFLMTGSLINEYSGQFSALGLGVTAPTAPTILHIKDTAAGGDPIALLEANAGTDNARIRFSNSDVLYDLGAYGSSGDSFQIVQDQTGTPRFPFIINKDTVSYTLYSAGDSVGIGLGVSTSTILTPLPAGSLQAAGRVSGSSLRAGIISASDSGINIHGTASYANYATTAGSVTAVNLSEVVMAGGGAASLYSASNAFNSAFNIVSNGGIIKGTNIQYLTGGGLKDSSGETIINGNINTNTLEFGDMFQGGGGEGARWYLDTTNDISYFKCDGIEPHSIHASGNITSVNKLLASGSASPSVVVGPNANAGSVNAASASLFINNLEFCNDATAYISNNNNSPLANLAFSAQGGSSNVSAIISGSKDFTLNQSLIVLNKTGESDDSLRMSYKYGETSNHARMVFEGNGVITSNAATGNVWDWQPNTSDPGTYVFKYSIIGADETNPTSQQTNQVYVRTDQVTHWNGTRFFLIGTNNITNITGGLSSTIVTIGLGVGNNTMAVDCTGQVGKSISWKIFVEVEMVNAAVI